MFLTMTLLFLLDLVWNPWERWHAEKCLYECYLNCSSISEDGFSEFRSHRQIYFSWGVNTFWAAVS